MAVFHRNSVISARPGVAFFLLLVQMPLGRSGGKVRVGRGVRAGAARGRPVSLYPARVRAVGIYLPELGNIAARRSHLRTGPEGKFSANSFRCRRFRRGRQTAERVAFALM